MADFIVQILKNARCEAVTESASVTMNHAEKTLFTVRNPPPVPLAPCQNAGNPIHVRNLPLKAAKAFGAEAEAWLLTLGIKLAVHRKRQAAAPRITACSRPPK